MELGVGAPLGFAALIFAVVVVVATAFVIAVDYLIAKLRRK